ncbi:hypothetical protein ACOSQ2_023577 [Xanthoceras sorbifolium]
MAREKAGSSDTRAAGIVLGKHGNRRKNKAKGWGSRFFFEQTWAEEGECRQIIKNGWLSNSAGTVVSILKDKFMVVYASLNDWNKLKRRKLGRDLSELHKELDALYARGSQVEVRRVKMVEDRIDRLLEQKEIYWRQRSRAFWLNFGD